MQKANTDLRTAIGFDIETAKSLTSGEEVIEFINMQLEAIGEPIFGDREQYPFLKFGKSLMAHYKAKDEMRGDVLPPVDLRIQAWLHDYLKEVDAPLPKLPSKTFSLTQHGIARTISLPADSDKFTSAITESYRIANGVLHNPRSDRRTTKGVFHVTEGGLPIPEDKKVVPKVAFARMLNAALNPPADLLELPFTQNQPNKARAWTSLLLRPVVCPEIPGFIAQKRMEVRFFAPASMVSNLDFVESIFGNAGDPYLRENDAGLDVENWSGHTGCVILAPHLTTLRKKDLGLPHVSEATDRQKRDSMCWEDEDELYNDGGAFKLTARDANGVIVTMVSDNYFGYCKKEVKTQMSFASNLMGLCEEEHAGGALAFASYDLGEDFRLNTRQYADADHTMADVQTILGDRITMQPEGHAIDNTDPRIIYVPEDAWFKLNDLSICWGNDNAKCVKLLAGKIYIMPSGYKIALVKPAEGRRWRLIGTRAQPTMAHKPCTVSGGGKSEISKSIADAIIHAPFFVRNLQMDLDYVEKIVSREYGMRFLDESKNRPQGRPVLSTERSLGSVIKLLTPLPEYTDEHNAFVRSIPTEIKELVLLLKRFYKPDWGDNWRERFNVDVINGIPGHELRYRGNPVVTSYLRVGYEQDGSWRVFGLRKDFAPAQKIQMEDDITASVVVPRSSLKSSVGNAPNPSLKFTYNCEYRLFQRPDDAVIRGYDHQTEHDMAREGNFMSNYAPLPRAQARELIEDAVRFDQFTPAMKQFIEGVDANPKGPDYFSCSAFPRIVDGKPTKNPRYLQTRLDLEYPLNSRVAEIGLRLYRRLRSEETVLTPVDVVCPGRRNNPPEGPIRCLAVFNPIHFLPLPEAFMEFTSSMTGKSPSTTGAGSEGALTKAPFNAILPIHDLNAALVSYIVTGYQPFITAAGFVGPKFRVDHDISLLVPEVWCRMARFEREPQYLIDEGLLEPVPEMDYKGKTLACSILGYRITETFVTRFMGRIFSNPQALFTEAMLRPEQQDMEAFADGIDNIMVTHERVAKNYFADGCIEAAVPPLKALLHIMRDGQFEGKDLKHPDIRKLFDRETVMQSDWYRERLKSQQQRDIWRAEKMKRYLESIRPFDGIEDKTASLAERLQRLRAPAYLDSLYGTIGRDPTIV